MVVNSNRRTKGRTQCAPLRILSENAIDVVRLAYVVQLHSFVKGQGNVVACCSNSRVSEVGSVVAVVQVDQLDVVRRSVLRELDERGLDVCRYRLGEDNHL